MNDNEITYKIEFLNNSTDQGSVMLFQQNPESESNEMSLVWFSKYAYPGTMVEFDWQPIYDFVWSQTGELEPGMSFSASQISPADLITNNAVTLHYDAAHAAYFFSPVTTSPGQAGSLYVTQDGSIPLNNAAVGIGMAGSPTFVVQAQPNINCTFTPHPQYWIAFGNYEAGEVLDPEAMINAMQIVFPSGIYAMKAILNPDNSWTIETAFD